MLPLRFTSRSHHLHVAKFESTTSAFNRDDETQKTNTETSTDSNTETNTETNEH